jgi:hypothetical protein
MGLLLGLPHYQVNPWERCYDLATDDEVKIYSKHLSVLYQSTLAKKFCSPGRCWVARMMGA